MKRCFAIHVLWLSLILLSGCNNMMSVSSTATPGGEADPYMRKGPYLMLTGSTTSMTVIWQAHTAIEKDATLEWGSEPDKYGPAQAVKETGSDMQFQHTIKHLPERSRTYYRVTIFESEKKTPHSYEGSFMTPSGASASSLTFYAYGDTRDNPSVHNNVLHWILKNSLESNLADERQTVLLHGGDFVHRGLEDEYWDTDYFQSNSRVGTSGLLRTIPVQGCVGNHECYTNGPVFHDNAALFRKYWPYELYPTSDFYYSFDYGPVHFIVVDPYLSEYTTGTPQYVWLEQELSKPSRTWKIVMFHYPPYDAGEEVEVGGGASDGHANKTDVRKYLCPLFEKYDVKLVLNGHAHYYARMEEPVSTNHSKKITYLILGGGGAPLSTPDAPGGNVVITRKDYHFARIEVAGNQIQVKVMKVEDGMPAPQIIDQFLVQ